jgi:methylisocitrate lyase
MVEHGRTPLLTPAELHELGFDLVVSPVSALFAAARAMRETLATLEEKGTLRDDLDQLVEFDAFTETVGLDEG